MDDFHNSIDSILVFKNLNSSDISKTAYNFVIM